LSYFFRTIFWRNAMDQSHEIVVCGVPFETSLEKEALRKLKDIGVTSVQIYTFWKELEPTRRSQFDWAFYDREVASIQEAGLKYVPFILMGPKYATPQWWLESPEHVGLRCLEHGKVSPIESIWNPLFRQEISRVLQAFAAHYLPMNVLESIQPGICGDYGEAIMPVTGNWPGDYHTHLGYWCGGADAIANFRAWLVEKYNAVEHLNRTWCSHYTDIKEITPFQAHKAPSRTAFFDQLEWYRRSMTEYAEFWMQTCRKFFPNTPIYLCTGGVEEPEQASSFSSQARIAAQHGGGVRLTNEGNKFYDNFFQTAYTHSACDFYGAYLGLEPVGPMTDKGVVARIFGSADYGIPQMFHYYSNLFDGVNPRPAADALRQYLPLVHKRPLERSVAFFWPSYYAAFNGGMPDVVNRALRFVRRMTNCLPVNEEMILDGALEQHSLLVIPFPGFTSRQVLGEIANWVRLGGVVLQSGLLTDLELERVVAYDELFGILPTSEEAWGIATQYILAGPELPTFGKVGEFTSSRSWLGLAPDVEFLASTHPGNAYSGTQTNLATATFCRKNGKGKAIFYCGPVVMEDDPEAVFVDRGTFKSLLRDVLAAYSHTIDLTPGLGEIARAQIGDEIYALKEGDIVKISSGVKPTKNIRKPYGHHPD
jgi:hypothetical protein